MPERSQRPHCHHFWVDSDPVIPVRRCGFKACGEDDIRLLWDNGTARGIWCVYGAVDDQRLFTDPSGKYVSGR